MEIKFEPMSVFDDAPETKSKSESSLPPKATPEPPTKEPSKEPAGEKKIAYTEAELEAMIQARLESQVEKALSAKMAEIMKMKDGGGGEETKAKEQKSSEDLEVEAAMERMRADEAKERAAKH